MIAKLCNLFRIFYERDFIFIFIFTFAFCFFLIHNSVGKQFFEIK